MRFNFLSFFIISILFTSCNSHFQKSSINDEILDQNDLVTVIKPKELKIFTRFETPENYKRSIQNTEFAKWLNNLSLKNSNVPVYTYEGRVKTNPNVYVGVIDLVQPKKNLQFNSNALLRLRAEYLYRSKNYKKLDELSNIKANPTTYTDFTNGDNSYNKFTEYLNNYLSSITPNSINELLTRVSLKEIQIGDIFFQSGNIKNHGVIVIDMAKNYKGQKLFILAQSYYPSQDIQVLTNPSNDFISPWYEAKEGVLLTPEWRFLTSDLMRFK